MFKYCELCARPFVPNNNRQKYCSKECRRVAIAPKRRKWARKYYYGHHEEILEKAKAYYHANKDEILKRRHENKKDGRKYEPDFYKRLDQCCREHGGIDNCPYSDCVCS